MLGGITVKATLTPKNRSNGRDPTEQPGLGDLVTEPRTRTPRTSARLRARPVPITTLFRAAAFRSGPDHHQGPTPITRRVFPVPDNVEKGPQAPPGMLKRRSYRRRVVPDWRTPSTACREFKSSVALIECPLNDDRAVPYRTVKKTIPTKPIRYVSIRITISIMRRPAGMRGRRSSILRGPKTSLTTKVWAMPHTLSPDRLARRRRGVIVAVADKRVLTMARGPWALSPQESNHADTI